MILKFFIFFSTFYKINSQNIIINIEYNNYNIRIQNQYYQQRNNNNWNINSILNSLDRNLRLVNISHKYLIIGSSIFYYYFWNNNNNNYINIFLNYINNFFKKNETNINKK